MVDVFVERFNEEAALQVLERDGMLALVAGGQMAAFVPHELELSEKGQGLTNSVRGSHTMRLIKAIDDFSVTKTR